MSPHGSILFRDVEVARERTDVLVLDGRIHRVEPGLRPRPGVELVEVDGAGGALLPGLHDHHLHLAATAAAMDSVQVGPPMVTTIEQFAAALAHADERLASDRRPDDTWVRAVGYHESVAGRLDREVLDRVLPHRPLRVQDRSGIRWTLNSLALDRVGAATASHPGIGRDGSGRPSGPIDRGDDWLRAAIGDEFPDLTRVGRVLASLGITGVTDCTPYADASGPCAIAAAVEDGRLSQAVHVTGGVELVDHPAPTPLLLGPVKVVLDDDRLPDLADLVQSVRAAHRARRGVAVHLVTSATLAFALAAWDEAGVRPGDRVEHGSVISPPAAARLAELGLTVVTQPGFVAERGDRYLVDVDPDEVPHLYRCGSLLALGVPVAAGSDAPYTDPDPWRAVRAAVDRRTRAGVVLGPDERVSPEVALALFLGDPLDPGGRPRRVIPGAVADLCLLDRPLWAGDTLPTADAVRSTYRAGVRI